MKVYLFELNYNEKKVFLNTLIFWDALAESSPESCKYLQV